MEAVFLFYDSCDVSYSLALRFVVLLTIMPFFSVCPWNGSTVKIKTGHQNTTEKSVKLVRKSKRCRS